MHCTMSGEAYRQNPSMGESYGNSSGQACMGMIESGMKNTEIAQEMRERYLVSAKKTALAITIANRSGHFFRILIMSMVTAYM